MDIFSQIIEVKKRYNYTMSTLSKGGLELWEAKEYLTLLDNYRAEIQDLQAQINAYDMIFSQ